MLPKKGKVLKVETVPSASQLFLEMAMIMISIWILQGSKSKFHLQALPSLRYSVSAFTVEFYSFCSLELRKKKINLILAQC